MFSFSQLQPWHVRSCQLEVIKKKKIKLWIDDYLVHNILKRQLLDAKQYTS